MSDALFSLLERELAATRRSKLEALADAVRARVRRFELQHNVLVDAQRPDAHLAVLAPRQVGKTTGLLATVLDFGLRNPGANILYVTLVRDSARRNFWHPLLRWNDELELGLEFIHAELMAWFPGGALLTLRGAEAENDVEKFRGESRDLIIVDEAKSFKADLFHYMMKEAIAPSLKAKRGRLILAGTPGEVLAGPFFDTTAPESGAFEIVDGRAVSRPYVERNDPKWSGVEFAFSFHGWSLADAEATGIPALVNVARGAYDDKERYGWGDQHPIWLREWCGRWIADDSRLVYRYQPARNDWEPQRTAKNPHGLPEGHAWFFVVGADLGAIDPFALVAFAYSPTHPNAYQVYEYSEAALTVPQQIAAARRLVEMLGRERVLAMVGDFITLGDSIHRTFSEEGLYFFKAEKKDKRDHIELFNADLQEQRLWLLRGSQLGQQMLYLAWDDTGLKEKSGQRNDLCDAAVYAIRWLKHRDFVAPKTAPAPGTPEAVNADNAAAEDKWLKRRIAERTKERFRDRPRWGDDDE